MNFRKQAKRGLLLGLICGLGLVSVLAGRMVLDSSRQLEVGAADIPELRDGHVDRLSQAVKIQTISSTKWEDFNQEAFGTFHTWLQSSFPKVATNLKRQPIEPCSVTYTWQGSQPDLEPALLISHLDVVPVEPQAASQWTHPPFSGAIGQGYIWGRGTLDDKLGVVGILEAAETLLEAGFTPARTHVFAFGCDEEVGGNLGARHIAEAFQKENKQFAYVLDEGHIIGKGLFPGTDAPIAFVGLAEKGFLTLTLTATQEGGHSSMPPKSTSVGILSRAVSRLEADPPAAAMNAPTEAMFAHIAPEIGFPNRMVFGNLWLFEPVVLSILTAKRTTNATVRTTLAPTILRAGVQDNVLPKEAVAKINFRIAPGDSIENVIAYVEDTIDDERVVVSYDKIGFNSNPSRVSDPESPHYTRIARSIRGVFGPETIVVPALTIAGTDARYYESFSTAVFRFAPLELGPGDPARIHGVDERISTANYGRVIQFYMALIKDGHSTPR